MILYEYHYLNDIHGIDCSGVSTHKQVVLGILSKKGSIGSDYVQDAKQSFVQRNSVGTDPAIVGQ